MLTPLLAGRERIARDRRGDDRVPSGRARRGAERQPEHQPDQPSGTKHGNHDVLHSSLYVIVWGLWNPHGPCIVCPTARGYRPRSTSTLARRSDPYGADRITLRADSVLSA